jgi:hypothetical protein
MVIFSDLIMVHAPFVTVSYGKDRHGIARRQGVAREILRDESGNYAQGSVSIPQRGNNNAVEYFDNSNTINID